MQRRTFLAKLTALSSAALLPGCQGAAEPLRIASHLWPGYEFLFLARREGWISPQDTQLIESGSATASIRLLAAGQADGAALTLDEMLGARQRGLPLVAVLVFDISLGADVLLARPGTDTLAQLRGKRIGYESSAVGALMLHKALAAASLPRGDIKAVPVTHERHALAWRAGEVDALITFEPVSGQLEAEGAQRLFDSSRIPDTIFDILAVTTAALQRNPAALRRLVAAHFQGLRNFHKNPNDTAYRLAERFKLPAREVIGAFKGLELPNENRNLKLLRGDNAPIVKSARELSDVLFDAGLLSARVSDFSRLFSADFIPRE